jgi:hypothetical protein
MDESIMFGDGQEEIELVVLRKATLTAVYAQPTP